MKAGGKALLLGDVQVGFLSEQPCEIVVTGDAPDRSSMTCGQLDVGGARGPGIIRIENGAVLFAQYSLKLDERGTLDATTGRVAIGFTVALPEIGKNLQEWSPVGEVTLTGTNGRFRAPAPRESLPAAFYRVGAR